MDQNDKFAVSDAFNMFEATADTALNEARTAEKRSLGFPLPSNLNFTGHITAVTAVVSPVTTGPDGQPKGGNPYVRLEVTVVSPEQYKGKKVSRNFMLNATAKQTQAQRYQWFLDFAEETGMPREVRQGKLAQICQWFGNNVSRLVNFKTFDDNYAGNDENINFKPVPAPLSGALPGATTTASAIAGNAPGSAPAAFQVNETVLFLGNPAVITGTNGDTVQLMMSNGTPMTVTADKLSRP